MTEDQIERKVEQKINSLDAYFLNGKLSQVEYDKFIKEINDWADKEYATAAAEARAAINDGKINWKG